MDQIETMPQEYDHFCFRGQIESIL